MSLRRATLLAALGMAVGILTGLSYSTGSQVGLATLFYAEQVLLFVVFLMLYREMRGTGKPRHRQDLAILATLVSGILFHLSLSRGLTQLELHGRGFQPAYWVVNEVLIPIAWIAFLILLVKNPAPLESRAMRVVAPVLAVLSLARLAWSGYYLFMRVGMAWLNLSFQRSISGLFWNLFLGPALELFSELSMVLFLVLLWRSTWNRRLQ